MKKNNSDFENYLRPPDHSAEIRRVQRIKGQMDGIRRMIEENRHCPEILIQTKAVTAAIRSLESALLEKHLRHCVHSAMSSKNSSDVETTTKELIEIFQKRLPG